MYRSRSDFTTESTEEPQKHSEKKKKKKKKKKKVKSTPDAKFTKCAKKHEKKF